MQKKKTITPKHKKIPKNKISQKKAQKILQNKNCLETNKIFFKNFFTKKICFPKLIIFFKTQKQKKSKKN